MRKKPVNNEAFDVLLKHLHKWYWLGILNILLQLFPSHVLVRLGSVKTRGMLILPFGTVISLRFRLTPTPFLGEALVDKRFNQNPFL